MKQRLRNQVHSGDLFSFKIRPMKRCPMLILVGFVAGQGVTLRYVLLQHARVLEMYQQAILCINGLA
jgi:hypothetical protein